jgi:hypothetical protein
VFLFVNQQEEPMKITGTYASDGVFGKTVSIIRAEGLWRTDYGEAPCIPAFTQEYAIDFGAGVVGQGHFDGTVLRGSFHPKSFANYLVNGVLIPLRTTSFPFLMGEFEATSRDDGNFDVVIKLWDGKLPGKGDSRSQLTQTGSTPRAGVLEPNYEIVKDVWRRPS